MAKRRFEVTLTARVELEIDDAVIAAVDDSWRKQFYPLRTPEEVASHVAFNMVANGCAHVNEIDGFADMRFDAGEVVNVEWDQDGDAVEMLVSQAASNPSPPKTKKTAKRKAKAKR